METTELKTTDYWESAGVDIRVQSSPTIDLAGFNDAIEQHEIESAVVVATSGTQGNPKLIVLKKAALFHSAGAVNNYCNIESNDIWLAGLSTLHVGGLGIYARAFLSGSKINEMLWSSWTRDGSAFLEACQDSTITSLTPVHLYDLVQSKIAPPPTLRGVFVGGGALSEVIATQAKDLEWPIWTTYGMTEAASQIATSLEGNLGWLPIMPHWKTQLSSEGKLRIRGKALMKGYFASDDSGEWIWHPTDPDGYYTTEDLVEIQGNKLKSRGRVDDHIKIYGELVSPGNLEQSLETALGLRVIVIPVDHPRKGHELIALIEGAKSEKTKQSLDHWMQSRAKFEQIAEYRYIPEFPRTPGGKIDRTAIRDLC